MYILLFLTSNVYGARLARLYLGSVGWVDARCHVILFAPDVPPTDTKSSLLVDHTLELYHVLLTHTCILLPEI